MVTLARLDRRVEFSECAVPGGDVGVIGGELACERGVCVDGVICSWRLGCVGSLGDFFLRPTDPGCVDEVRVEASVRCAGSGQNDARLGEAYVGVMISSLEEIWQRPETAMLCSEAPSGVVISSLPGEITVRLKQPSHIPEAYMMGRPQNLQPDVVVDGIVVCARLNLKSKLVREVEQSSRSCVSCISSSLSFAFSTASLS